MSSDTNHISTVRKHLIEQMEALRSARTSEAIQLEIDRAKGLSELAQAVVNTAKVETDYLRIAGSGKSGFLEEQPASATPSLGHTPSGYTQGTVERLPGVTRHRLGG